MFVINQSKLFGRNETFANVPKEIAPGDGMLQPGDQEHYFVVGASASAAINDALRTARIAPKNISRVLDYACGYGRVLRWLKADFPAAYLVGVDADPKAARAAGNVVGVETRALDITLAGGLGDPFDLIWVGSLFTHLPAQETARVLRYLRGHLTNIGVLVFTTHGAIVEQRLSSRTRIYGLAEDAVDTVLLGVSQSGYGFAGYPHSPSYGISIARPSRMIAMLEAEGMRSIMFKDQGWAAHQDVYASRLAPDA